MIFGYDSVFANRKQARMALYESRNDKAGFKANILNRTRDMILIR
jgi:hypothetical protein